MNDQQPIDLDKERRLNHAIGRLADSESTPSDLWPSVKAQILALDEISASAGADNQAQPMTNVETKLFAWRWNSWAIAASLMLCVGSVTYSWQQLAKAKAIYAQVSEMQAHIETHQSLLANAANKNSLTNNAIAEQTKQWSLNSADNSEVNSEYYSKQVAAMEREFKTAKASLMARISMNRTNIDEALFSQIEIELMEIERATLVLKKAMGRQQVDANFTNLLRVTYQQELTVLTQLAKLDATI